MTATRLRVGRGNMPLDRVVGWLASEKLDGVRCLWDGRRLWAKSGRRMDAPRWFVAGLPRGFRLDGELYAGAGTRAKLSGLTMNPRNPWWKRVRYRVFDHPGPGGFAARVGAVKKRYDALHKGGRRLWKPVRHTVVRSSEHLRGMFERILNGGGEGMVVRCPISDYKPGRSKMYKKFKPRGLS